MPRFSRNSERGSKSTKAQSARRGTAAGHRRSEPEPEFNIQPKRASEAPVIALNDAQRAYDNAIATSTITFGVGPAGTGKTWLAAIRAADALKNREIERLYITRPAVEAGENLGFLPGTLDDKYAPYLLPVREALEERLGSGQLEYLLRKNIIMPRPIAYMRGTTFKNSWLIFDEAQNATPTQMKLVLSRIGQGAKFIVNGDIRQSDISGKSGLEDAIRRLRGVDSLSICTFTNADIVRSGMCQAIIERYEEAA
jgi:phosphate starvation-inducible PhoH-like protein